jgi:hypothetical protein
LAKAHPDYILQMDPSIGVSPVPIPGSAGLMTMGLAMLAAVWRMRALKA